MRPSLNIRSICILTLLLCSAFIKSPAMAWQYQGQISLESRVFEDDEEEQTQDFNLSLFTRLEAKNRQGPWRVKLRGTARVDSEDSERNMVVGEEAWVDYKQNRWNCRLGKQMMNWTATEAFHPADTFNSRVWDSNIENADKLGETTLMLGARILSGSLSLYYMPCYEEPRFPSASSRLSTVEPGVKFKDAVFIDRNDEVGDNYGHQFGLRLAQSIGSADIGIHTLWHQDRYHPVVLEADEEQSLVPVYLPITEYGLSYQQVCGGLITKIEYGYKDFDNPQKPIKIPGVDGLSEVHQFDHYQFAWGFEYGWSSPKGADMVFYLEGQIVDALDLEQQNSISSFQRDIMLGYRYAWNDIYSRELFISLIFDVEFPRERLYNLRYRQRITDNFSASIGIRYIQALQSSDGRQGGLQGLDGSNQLFFVLSRYF